MAINSFDSPKEAVKNGFHTNVNVIRSAMFPVWFMSYRNRDRVAYATVNGQTGKVTADIPMSVPKYFVAAAIITTLLFGLFQMLFTIMPDLLATIVAILGIISVLTYGAEIKKIVAKENYDDDLGMQYRDARIREKKKARMQAQKGAQFGDTGNSQNAYVLTDNDIRRAKREQARSKKATQSSAGILTTVIVAFCIFIAVGSSFGGLLESMVQSGNVRWLGAIISLVGLIIAIVSMIDAKKNISMMRSHRALPASMWSVISMFVLLVVCIWDPANDIIYYTAVILAMIGVILNILGIITSYNLLAMRPLPQFERYQGGDDRA